MRVRVPFGRRTVTGMVLGSAPHSDVPRDRLKRVQAVLDAAPLLDSATLEFLRWVADYYHHPVGEVMQTVLPVLLRQTHVLGDEGIPVWRVTAAGQGQSPADLTRAVVQAKLLQALQQVPAGLQAEALAALSEGWRTPLRALQDKGWVQMERVDCLAAQHPPAAADAPPAQNPVPNPAQAEAVAAIVAATGGFQCLLLHGITGSGKTEVYLQAISHMLAQGGQVLVLVPEIGLTPQLLQRFQQRFPVPIAVLHSALNDTERLCAWDMARRGKAPLVIGTRSAVFTPMPQLRLIIVDEEHDGSYKQQDGLRYSARDLAVVRASRERIPVVLGSATPSLESLNNARQGRYRLLPLPERTGSSVLPRVRLLDLRSLALNDGISAPLVDAIKARLQRQEQSLVFLNRRGFSPVWMCHDCGWLAPCARCDARMTLHRGSGRLRCHHCGSEGPVPTICPACQSANLHPLGEGTERVEDALARLFPAARVIRIDRDSTRRKGALEDKLRRIHAGEADILVGTQMLAKGHDFPNLTLVGVLNADQGLYGVDFRSGEQLFQRIVQVAGRAGRADKPGEVLIQTYHPDNPVFSALLQHDYEAYAQYALDERQQAQYPPFSHLALLRAESPNTGVALAFLQQAYTLAGPLNDGQRVQLMQPLPSPMEKRAGRYRAQLLVQSAQRGALHDFLARWLAQLDELPAGRKVRWSLDVDPVDMH